MSSSRLDVTEAELAVLEILWDDEPATIRHLTDRLYPEGGTSHYATVQKLLERLEGKSCVTRDRERVPHRFRTLVSRGALVARRLRGVADALCEGAIAPLFTHLAENDGLDEGDLDALRELVDRLDAKRETDA